ncbi:hypothetical protein NQ317_004320 [Molorchus minor]|uniref:PIH1 N-terminal domain-containing protein n=1 Tax=Molorchus minor TaxID=1323400 RepID=A0ABQ9JY58_9CUCU|nr:hypothetical protein NQ317_004320 [Molorchus minor]
MYSSGFCVKTKEVGTDTKVFVNICHTDAIPPPKDVTDRELTEIIDSDAPGDYRIPMSIGGTPTSQRQKRGGGQGVRLSYTSHFPEESGGESNI